MTATIDTHPDPETDRQAWLEARKTGIGGSDAAAIVGLSPWQSPIEVYLDKTNPNAEERTNEAMNWGHYLEDAVARHFADVNGCTITPAQPMKRHPDHPFMFANVDRFAHFDGDIRIYEGKTHSAFQAADWDNGPPDHAVVQVMHYLACWELTRAHVAVLIGGSEYRQFEVDRDDQLIANLIDLEAEFWDRVQNANPPPAGATDGAARALLRLYPEGDDTIDLEPDVLTLVRDLHVATAAKKSIETECRTLSNQIKERLGAHKYGQVDGRKVATWSRWTEQRFDLKRFREEHPDLAEQYLTEQTRDRLTPAKLEGNQ